MSVFDLPRINVAGHLRLNPGTANNEDYAQPGASSQALMPDGEAMGLLDTGQVRVREFHKSDAEFVEWIQQAQPFAAPDGTINHYFPAEWNYYGDMSAMTLDIKVTGVQTEPGSVLIARDPAVPLTKVLGARLSYNGVTTDINPEGSPPATQFFIDDLVLADDEVTFISGGRTTKGVGLWINFFRNVALVADDGAGTYLHHVISDAHLDLPGFEDADGVVLRYGLSLPLLDDPTVENDSVLEQYFRDRRANPKTLDLVGTLAPYHEGEPISMPPGRQLISRSLNIPTPTKHNNGSGHIALAPAAVGRSGQWLTVDAVGAFPDAHTGDGRDNPKFDFGDVTLHVVTDDRSACIGPVPYLDRVAGDRCGWLFDLDITDADKDAAELLELESARLELHSTHHGTVLREVDYYIVTDQLAAYAEQYGSDREFVSQGGAEPVEISVYHRGVRLAVDECPPISMWQYRSTPIQQPGDARLVNDALFPGDDIIVPTDEAGTYLLTFRAEGETNPPAHVFPPPSYAHFAYPPEFAVTWAPQVSVRVLPNVDYSQYFIDPDADDPIGNADLTWDVVYREVLRTYALLYPAMNNKFRLDDRDAVAEFAPYVIDAVRPENWHSTRYMPPTRDLSASRRRLLQAWCRSALASREASIRRGAAGPTT